ncbi:GrlR family regulatory protein [Janthinobacterium sp. P210006]|uniref:GrlR family regulatory protein n=1 Tax=Janthinobacterium sp. P210006 TaxID=3112939 RepID=UPI002E2570CD|nr:GrlR family regulatory protein [Janthinobacterium sp. P210006]
MSIIKDGFYKVAFAAGLPGEGGLVVAKDDAVYGGDSQFLYSGSATGDSSAVASTITVSALSGAAKSVFGGTGGKFVLHVKGTASDANFHLAAPAPIPGAQGIVITGTWIAPLDL